jgi:hypothetical protein
MIVGIVIVAASVIGTRVIVSAQGGRGKGCQKRRRVRIHRGSRSRSRSRGAPRTAHSVRRHLYPQRLPNLAHVQYGRPRNVFVGNASGTRCSTADAKSGRAFVQLKCYPQLRICCAGGRLDDSPRHINGILRTMQYVQLGDTASQINYLYIGYICYTFGVASYCYRNVPDDSFGLGRTTSRTPSKYRNFRTQQHIRIGSPAGFLHEAEQATNMGRDL